MKSLDELKDEIVSAACLWANTPSHDFSTSEKLFAAIREYLAAPSQKRPREWILMNHFAEGHCVVSGDGIKKEEKVLVREVFPQPDNL